MSIAALSASTGSSNVKTGEYQFTVETSGRSRWLGGWKKEKVEEEEKQAAAFQVNILNPLTGNFLDKLKFSVNYHLFNLMFQATKTVPLRQQQQTIKTVSEVILYFHPSKRKPRAVKVTTISGKC